MKLPQRLLESPPGHCVCAQVRELARKMSSFYDAALAPESITITQYSLMANIARSGELQHTALAEKAGMERTTLTRNLHPLIRGQLVKVVPGIDRRQKLLQLTSNGKRKLARALPLWERARDGFVDEFGASQTDQLLKLIGKAQSVISGAEKRRQPRMDPPPQGLRRGRLRMNANRVNFSSPR